MQVGQVITRRWHSSPGDTITHAGRGASPYMGALVFSLKHASSPKGLCGGVFGATTVRSQDGKSCHLAALPACSSSESFPCLFIFGIYLFTTELSPRAGWLCWALSMAWWLLPALSKSHSAGSVSTQSWGGERSGSCESNATAISHQNHVWF